MSSSRKKSRSAHSASGVSWFGATKKPHSARFVSFRLVKRWLRYAVLLAAVCGAGLYLPGKVVRVHDGDTVTVLDKEGGFRKLRLYGIDSPEIGQPGGQEALAFLQDTVFMKSVQVSVVNKDRFGREVAIVTLSDGVVLNEALVKNGHAWVYASFCQRPQCAAWKAHETSARRSKTGLWAKPGAKAPWAWRQVK